MPSSPSAPTGPSRSRRPARPSQCTCGRCPRAGWSRLGGSRYQKCRRPAPGPSDSCRTSRHPRRRSPPVVVAAPAERCVRAPRVATEAYVSTDACRRPCSRALERAARLASMRLTLVLTLFIVLAACGSGPSTTGGSERDVVRDGGCADAAPPPSVPCTDNSTCLDSYAPYSPTGKVHAVCFEGYCRSAAACTETHAGAANHCECGPGTFLGPQGCIGICLTAPGESDPACVSACM